MSTGALVEELQDILGEKKKHTKKPKLGSGKRFAALAQKLGTRDDVDDPAALAAWIGRKNLGNARFAKLASAARKRHGKGK